MTIAAQHECLVIGGGLAGSMAALRLARAGRPVLLVEREAAAHAKVCGEFLSPEAVAYLRHAGVDPLALCAAGIGRLRVLMGRRAIEVELPFQALSLSRSALDEALLQRARDAGAGVRRGIALTRLQRGPNGWVAACSDGASLEARSVFLATGKHDLRGWARPAGAHNDLVGFKMHWRLAPAQVQVLRGVMALFLFADGYGGLTLVEDDLANLCLVVRRSRLQRSGGWMELLAEIAQGNPAMAELLAGADPLWKRPLAISPIPYGFLAGGSAARDGLWRLGDQAAVIPSFTGDGMSIALHSGALAAAMYLAGASAGAYQRAMRRQLHSGIRLATLVSRAMVSGMGRMAAPVALAVCPAVIRWIAEGTRIPAGALAEMALV
ncbi:MAG: NAD(P)/FAD-dependent oxidoreductase [Terracidiphilus sp.]